MFCDILNMHKSHCRPGLCQEVQQICLTVGLPDVTKEYVHRKEALGAMEYYSMKIAKEQMSGKEKCRHIVKMDCRKMQPYMQRISLELSRTEFLWNTDMLDTRTTMKAKYMKDQSWCPHFPLGRSVGVT